MLSPEILKFLEELKEALGGDNGTAPEDDCDASLRVALGVSPIRRSSFSAYWTKQPFQWPMPKDGDEVELGPISACGSSDEGHKVFATTPTTGVRIRVAQSDPRQSTDAAS